MATRPKTVDQVRKVFRARKVMTLDQLARHLACSNRTVHRRLKMWQAINSYNQNGRYYTLPNVPQFDAHGLWHYRDIRFSRFGNLSQTVTQLVHHAPAGLAASQLEDLLGLAARSFLSPFRNHPALNREAHQARWVYYAADPKIYRQQKAARRTISSATELPTDTQAIAILVQTIKHPNFSIEQRCASLKRQQIPVSKQAVINLFAHHRLGLKKTSRSPS